MKQRTVERDAAIVLRKRGATYTEILTQVPVARSTLSVWLKNLPLTLNEKKYLKTRANANISNGRVKAATQHHQNKIHREKLLYVQQKNVFTNLNSDSIFLLGVALYWAEGSNKYPMFHFMNSDPHMIKFMYFWVQKYLKISSDRIGIRIYMHKVYSQHECELFWLQLLQAQKFQLKKTIFKPTSKQVRSNVHYRGCVRLEVSGIANYHKMMVWKKAMQTYILEQVSQD